jgi:hypothetical protein
MNTHDPNDLEILIAYRQGDIKDDEVIQKIRVSDAALSWLRNYRLIHILAKQTDSSFEGPIFDHQKLFDFWNEMLPPEEMLAAEQSLTNDPEQFDEYLSVRLEATAEVSSSVPSALDDLVRSQIIGANKAASQTETKDVEAQSWLRKISEFLGQVITSHKAGWASGLAVASLLLFIGSDLLVQNSNHQFPPLIIASLEPSETSLAFRGNSEIATPSYNKQAELIFAEFYTSKKFVELLHAYNSKGLPDTYTLLAEEIYNLVKGTNRDINVSGPIENPSSLQIQISEKLWDELNNSKYLRRKISLSLEGKQKTSSFYTLYLFTN